MNKQDDGQVVPVKCAHIIESADCLRNQLVQSQARVKEMRRAYALAASAADVLQTSRGGHGHWDKTMRHGAGCPICIGQAKGRREADKLLREAAEAAKEPHNGKG